MQPLITYLRDVLALGFPLLVGGPLVLALAPAQGWMTRFGLAFLFGGAATGVVLTAVGIVGVPMRGELLAVLLLAWLVGWGIVLRHRLVGLRPAWPLVMNPVVALLLGLTLINVATAGRQGLTTPIGISDVLSIWLPKVARLAGTHSLLALNHTTFPDYPPLWPLHLFLTRDLAGHANTVRLLPALYLTSLLAVTFGYLASRTTPWLAAATVWVVSGIPYLWFPYGVNDLMAEVPFTAFLVASAICLVRYLEEDEARQLAGAVLLATGAALTRPEGIEHAVLLGVLAGVVAVKRRRPPALIAAPVVVPLVAYVAWDLAIKLAPHGARGYGVDPRRLLGVITPDALITIASYAVRWLANPYVFGPTVIAVCLCVAGYRSWRRTWPWLTIFALDLAAIGLTYLIAPASNDQPLTWWLITGFKRMLLHIVPLLFIAAAVAIAGGLQPSNPDPPPPAWRPGRARRWGRAILPALGLGAAAVLTVGVAAPGTVRVADLVPNGVVGIVPPLGFGRLTSAGWVDGPGADSVLLRVQTPVRGSVTYDLNNLGERASPNEEVVGRFSGLDATAGALTSGAGSRLQVTANGRALGSASLASGPTSFEVNIPADARTLSLIAEPGLDGSSVQSIWVHAALHRGGAWPLVAALLLLAAMVAAVPALRKENLTLPLSGLLLAALTVQQLDVLSNEAVPLWSVPAQVIARHLGLG